MAYKRLISKTILLILSANLLSSAQAALWSRAGGQAYYDDVLDLTWLTDSNYAKSESFGIPGINVNGEMNIPTANDWIAALNAANHLTVSTWRLPEVDPAYVAGVSCSSPPANDPLCKEDEHNYNFLGNGVSNSNPAPFLNVAPQNFLYWYSTPSGAGKNARTSYGSAGRGNADSITGENLVWAVADGDVVPAIYFRNGEDLVNVNERMVMLGNAWVMRRFYGHLPKDRQLKLNQLELWAKKK